jgi:putative nucleotidyltransferase with HDIG domain
VTCAGSTTPRVVRELDERQRTRELDRSQALVGLRALARAIDAKDPATQEHSERVATLTARLAIARGWAPSRVALLRDAALLHDVGKIGVPDAILLKDGPLDDDEFAIVREHSVLGARIVGDVLDEEQIAWIAGHHERPDGSGYPGARGGRRRARGRRAARSRGRLGRDGLRSLLQPAEDARGRPVRGAGVRGDAVRADGRRGARDVGTARRPHARRGTAAPADGVSALRSRRASRTRRGGAS